MIKLDNVYHTYGKDIPLALKSINLNLYKGQWVVILGANGSGKSTLAKLLNGLLLPVSGRVIIDGKETQDINLLPDIRKKVAFVFQNPDNQIVATTVEDDIAFALENMGLEAGEITVRVERALEITKLKILAEKEPHLLSGGEKQRLAIASALAIASDYLVLDEPTSMLDPHMSEEILDTLKYLKLNFGLGIIYVTNNIEEALFADRVIVLKEGEVAADASPREIFSDHQRALFWGIDMPTFSYLASRLAKAGYNKLQGALTLEEVVEGLCK